MRLHPISRQNTWIEILNFYSGILLFTFFITGKITSIPIALAGIILAIVMVGIRLESAADLIRAFGFSRLKKGSLYFLFISILAAFILGMLYRQSLELWILPRRLFPFALMASLIGATEELVFRGYIQTRLRVINIFVAVFAGALAHTCYKLVLFWSLESGALINYQGLIIWTLIGGLVFGILREASKNVIFPLICHVIFDIIVYGDRVIHPWWIWG